MKKVKEQSGSHDYKDAIELMFFSYRDFISDPDAILQKHGFGRAHHRVLHFVGCNPGLSIADLLNILRVTKQSLRAFCVNSSTRAILIKKLVFMTGASAFCS